MKNVLVLEEKGGCICALLREKGCERGLAYRFLSQSEQDSPCYDAIIFCGGRLNTPLECDILVLDSRLSKKAARYISARCAVTFGLCSRDTVTLSAAMEGTVVSVQRELPTLGGEVIAPRELMYRTSLKGEQALACCTAELICKMM